MHDNEEKTRATHVYNLQGMISIANNLGIDYKSGNDSRDKDYPGNTRFVVLNCMYEIR